MERKPARYAELEALPDHVIGEIVDGTLYASSRPPMLHAFATSRLLAAVGGPFSLGRDGPGGWMVLFKPELHLGDDVLVPDVTGWRHERMPEVPDTAAIPLAPDWVCEVLSPSSVAFDRADKLPVYARERVPHVWFVDPVARTLEVLRLKGEHYSLWATHVGSARVRAEPFEAIELELAVLCGKS